MADSSLMVLVLIGSSILLPFALSLVLQLLLRWLQQKQPAIQIMGHLDMDSPAFLGLAVVTSFAVAFKVIAPPLAFPPVLAIDGVFVLAILGGLYAVLIAKVHLSVLVRVGLQCLILSVGSYFLLRPLLAQWSLIESIVQCVVGLVLWLGLWNSLEQMAKKNADLLLNTTLLALPTAAAPIIALGGTLLISQVMTALAASIGAYWVLSLWRDEPHALRGLVGVFVPTFGGLLLMAYQYAEVNLWALLLLLTFVACTCVYRRVFGQRFHEDFRSVFLLSACFMMPLSIALFLVWPEDSFY